MRIQLFALVSALTLLPLNAGAIEGWGVDEQLEKPQVPQSQIPQEPEAVEPEPEEEVPATATTPATDGVSAPEATQAEPVTPEKQAASPAILDPETEEGDVEATDETPKWKETKKARLQGLNKVTARTSEIKNTVGEGTRFGNLEIKIEKCLRGPDDEKVENTALITIWDEIPGQQRREVFRGWMFSSSPAISALEHPIYDVILLSCDTEEKPAEAPKATDKAKDAKTPEKKK